MRFPSVVGAMLASALLVVLARKLFDRRIALLSGLFLATSPYFVKWSQQARVYPLLVAASLVATLLLLRALERELALRLGAVRDSRTRAARHACGRRAPASPRACGAHRPASRASPAARPARGSSSSPRSVFRGSPSSRCARTARRARRRGSRSRRPSPLTRATARRLGHRRARRSACSCRSLVPAPSRESRISRCGSRRGRSGRSLLALVISIARPIFLDRYLVTAAPAFAMLAAVAVMGLAGRLRAGVVVAAAVATAIGLVLWYSTADDGNWRGEDWRSAVATVIERRGEADAIVVAPWWTHDAAEYYGAHRRRRLDGGLDLGSPLVGRRPGASGRRAASARLRRSRAGRDASVRLEGERAALAAPS